MEVKGKGGISAKIIADSVSSINGQRITTFELNYPRFIHSEFMTHRLFSRNAASSRAIPVEKVIEQVENNPAMPIHWGKNQKGMQAKEELWGLNQTRARDEWYSAADSSTDNARFIAEHGTHKQIVNRILEPYQFIKVVCTATEFDNFFWLRCHEDAQPEIKELADCMYEAYSKSEPWKLSPGEWHTPYVSHMQGLRGDLWYYIEDEDGGDIILTKEQALKVSASCCAQVSFRSLDDSLDKAIKIYNMLVESKPVHASPFEHQATPMNSEDSYELLLDYMKNEKGVTSIDENLDFWSGNFKGWIQHRQLIDENTCWNYSL